MTSQTLVSPANPQLSKNLLKRSLKIKPQILMKLDGTYIDSRLDISSLVDLDFENLIKTQHCPPVGVSEMVS